MRFNRNVEIVVGNMLINFFKFNYYGFDVDQVIKGDWYICNGKVDIDNN